MKDGDIIQIAHVTRDLERTMKYFWETFKLGPWSIYTLDENLVRDQYVRGVPSNHTYLLALAWAGGVQYEIIQPLTGRSIYDEYLEKRGEGLHHIKFYYSDCKNAVRSYESRGFKVIQSGKIDDDMFFYLDTEQALGFITELGNNGRIRAASRVYPR